jgi:N-acetylglutamate synthase-like GNAT family acetyltransferase
MADWMAQLSKRNCIDTGIFSYPATDILKASNGHTVMYMPRQRVMFLESLAINPEAQSSDVALALRALLQVSEYESRNAGAGELYFLCRDEETCQFAERHGMEKMNFTLYRRKL